MAVSSHEENQLLQELDIPSSSEEDGIPRVARTSRPMRTMAAAFALCGAAAFAAVVVLKPATMGHMRASAQDALGLAASHFECQTCQTDFKYPNTIFDCGETVVKASGCSKAGCQSRSDNDNFCIQPVNSELITPAIVNGPFDYKFVCTTSPQNNPYECPAVNGTCSLKTCEVNKLYDGATSFCSENATNLTDAQCGKNGCVFNGPPKTECFAPNYTTLLSTRSLPPSYKYVCEYTGKKPSHPFMCPKPPSAAQCVLGNSVVNTLDGERLVRDAQIGDEILVKHGIYEPIIDFLHALPKHEGARVIHAVHSMGRLSASAEHVVFVMDRNSQRSVPKAMEDMLVGDMLIDSHGQRHEVTDVVDGISGSEGLFAPLTPSGTMIVDGMLMSNYAGVGGKRIPHGAMHAAFFLLRVWRAILPASDTVGEDVLNPMAKFLWRTAGPLVLPASP